jgi:hypothetical protein
VELDATRVVLYGDQITAQKINALFAALLKLTPFGKADAAK